MVFNEAKVHINNIKTKSFDVKFDLMKRYLCIFNRILHFKAEVFLV